MRVKVTERIPNFVDLDRDPYVTTVSKIPEIAQIDWIKEKNEGHAIELDRGVVKSSGGLVIALYEFL